METKGAEFKAVAGFREAVRLAMAASSGVWPDASSDDMRLSVALEGLFSK